jgi:DNA-binding ferritin-like protein (Dps family)
MSDTNQIQDLQSTIQIVWESLNGVLYDLTEGDKEDAVVTVEDLIDMLEEAGANPDTNQGESK